MISENIQLKQYNTFGIEAKASRFAPFSSVSELKELLASKNNNETLMILGGGSNVLFTQDFNGLLLKNNILGFELNEVSEDAIFVTSGAGENWHSFVLKTIDAGLCGLENLSLIPGNVGASPMQNIGAYGREIKDVFHQLEAYHIATGKIHTFNNADCKFGYRESVFKNEFKGQYVILKVTYKLSRVCQLNTSYGAIEEELATMNITHPTLKNVSDAVIAIRSSKLPNPVELGNAGSFFKNPVVSMDVLMKIQENFKDVPNYPVGNDQVKLAAGWLIEQAGWKGKVINNYGVHKKQALVLVNYGGATGNDVYALSTQIISDIKEKFGVELEREVNIV